MVKKIGEVPEAADKRDTKMTLSDPVTDPVEALVEGLRRLHRDDVGADADSALVIAI